MSGISIIIYAVCFLLIVVAGIIMFREYRKPKEIRRQKQLMTSMSLLLAASLLQLSHGLATNLQAVF
ncbi:hypothetical protein SAMN05421781_0381 [Marinococcus luteus]|uniref:Uncharacterized protein n=1 Tax=Marinococcus luteus TaxID=1122204 RepID=A0A1H2QMZ1_9BACI|nr:hypothetical protein [Marinococcus luteus]SDW08258.1 hypothetical protein SAMN05421781_0381 [Marinococcus luteus]